MSDFIATCIAGCEDQAIEEVRQAVGAVNAKRFFLKGVFFFSISFEKKVVFSKIKNANTSFLANIVCSMQKTNADIDAVILAVKECMVVKKKNSRTPQILIGAGELFKVECNRRGHHKFSSVDVCRKVGSFVVDFCGAKVNIKKPEKVVRVDIIGSEAFVSIDNAKDVVLSKKVEGFVKSTVGKKPSFDARNKMNDIFEKWGALISANKSFNTLDLGAAPGGWSVVLSKSCGKVFAVDTAYLSHETFVFPNIVHVKKEVSELVDSDFKGVSKMQLITCDVSMDIDMLEKMLFKVAVKFLEKGRFLVVTLKFPFRVRKETVESKIKEFKAIAIKNEFTLIETVSLKHNTGFEKTALLKFKI